MNINELTLGQAKELAALFSGTAAATPAPAHPMTGKHVIARCYAAGVHAGVVSSVDGDAVVLLQSRRMWSWKARDGVALSGLAQKGPKDGCKIDLMVPSIYLTGVCELIPTGPGVQGDIDGYK